VFGDVEAATSADYKSQAYFALPVGVVFVFVLPAQPVFTHSCLETCWNCQYFNSLDGKKHVCLSMASKARRMIANKRIFCTLCFAHAEIVCAKLQRKSYRSIFSLVWKSSKHPNATLLDFLHKALWEKLLQCDTLPCLSAHLAKMCFCKKTIVVVRTHWPANTTLVSPELQIERDATFYRKCANWRFFLSKCCSLSFRE